MNKIIIGLVASLMMLSSVAKAEVQYNYKNPEHKADKNCIAVYSVVKDLLYNDVKIMSDGSVWLKVIKNTDEVVAIRNEIGDLQDSLILKYAYSKQLNTHYNTYSLLIKQRINEQGPEYLASSILQCKKRGI